MYSWEDLKTNIVKNKCSYKFLRNNETQNRLNDYKTKIEEKYKSYDDFIKIKKLKYKNKKLVATKSYDSREYFISINTFPYDIEKGIKQYVLWTEKKLNNKKVNEILKEKFKNKEILWFYSDTRNTVPNVLHYHIFVKNLYI